MNITGYFVLSFLLMAPQCHAFLRPPVSLFGNYNRFYHQPKPFMTHLRLFSPSLPRPYNAEPFPIEEPVALVVADDTDDDDDIDIDIADDDYDVENDGQVSKRLYQMLNSNDDMDDIENYYNNYNKRVFNLYEITKRTPEQLQFASTGRFRSFRHPTVFTQIYKK